MAHATNATEAMSRHGKTCRRATRNLLSRLLAILILAGCAKEDSTAKPPAEPAPLQAIQLEQYHGGFFSMEKPAGWEVITAGSGTNLVIWIYDPTEPSRQAFDFFGIGPYYISDAQREVDQRYVAIGGMQQPWNDTPTVNPHTFSQLLTQWDQYTQCRMAQAFMPSMPRFENLRIISSQPAPAILGGNAEIVRALFTRNGRVAEGIFSGEMVRLAPPTPYPGGGIGMLKFFKGISAPKEEFDHFLPYLSRSMGSIIFQTAVVRQWQNDINTMGRAALRNSQTLSEGSDLLMESWQQRQKSYDIIAEKQRDAILGKERYYDPSNGEVFEFPAGWYDQYNLNRNAFNNKNLQPIPENNHEIWQKPPQDGPRLILPE